MPLRHLPKVDRVLDDPELRSECHELGRKAVTAVVRAVIGEIRDQARGGAAVPEAPEVLRRVKVACRRRGRARVERVINATGVVLHTNLGRAPLPSASLELITHLAGGYASLELDVESGARMRRGAAAEARLAELVSAEASLVVNNNAAAVLLSLSTLAAGRDVVVSRGELVEIGGGFRIPDVLARSGARLVEVGTTNRTRVEDYRRALDAGTVACILSVHPSNFKITGFAERPPLPELCNLAREHGVPLVKDLGGGLILEQSAERGSSEEPHFDLTRSPEPTVQACLEAGAGLVCFSLDKLFGGPQGGAVVGQRDLIERLRADPLARAVRVDKLTLAALDPVLTAYEQGAIDSIPVHGMLRASAAQLAARVDHWLAAVPAAWRDRCERVELVGAIGGGTLAEHPVPSVGLRIRAAEIDALAAAFRAGTPPVIGRVQDGALWLDARTVFESEDAAMASALALVLGQHGK